MSSPKRVRRDQDRRGGNIKDRLQALASKPSESKKVSSSLSSRLGPPRSKDSDRSRRDRNDKDSSRKKSPDRSKGEGSRWTKKLDEESKNPDRWGHSGFKELYGSDKTRRSRSKEKTSAHRSRSHDRQNRAEPGNRERSARKRSRSSSDRSPLRRSEPNRKRTNSNGAAASTSNNKSSKKPEERRRVAAVPAKKSQKKSLSPSPSRHQRSIKATKTKPKSDDNGKSRSSRPQSSPSSKRRPPPASLSDRSSSSRSRSRSSLSSSSSSTSSDSSSSSSSPERTAHRQAAVKPRRLPGPGDAQRLKVKLEGENKKARSSLERPSGKSSAKRANSESSSHSSSSDSGEVDEDGEEDDEEEGGMDEASNGTRRASSSGQGATRMSLSERFGKLAQLSSQRGRSLDELVQLRIVAPVGGSSEKNVSVDEGKAAPVIFRSGRMSSPRDRSADRQPLTTNHHRARHPPTANAHPYEEPIRQDERVRDDRWSDWHERYDQYRHVQPPRQLPRDWDDINVRHKYYTERGFFGHDMSLEDLSRWEDWWHRYQTWRRGYENAWIEMHGPNVPVEYPVEYRPGRDPVPMVGGGGGAPPGPTPSIRSRLGWRR